MSAKRENGPQLPNPLARVRRGRPGGSARAAARRAEERRELELARGLRAGTSHARALREWEIAMRGAVAGGSWVSGWQGKVS